MKARTGDVVLVELPSASGGPAKLRPVVVLAALPGAFQQYLVAGISTRTFGLVPGWDDWIDPRQPRYAAMGLNAASGVRLSYLEGIVEGRVKARIGRCEKPDVVEYRNRLGGLLANPL